jgi:AmmeMemoRadiSam system protein B
MKLLPVAAGTFYPADAKSLTKMLDAFAETPAADLPGKPAGFLLPHAGYVYSGVVAAMGYHSVRKAPATVAVVGPSHSVPFEGTAVFKGEAVKTPLGDLSVDQAAAEELLASHESLVEFPPAYEREHSVEVHFPLIKRFLPSSSVVPLVAGQGGVKAAAALASALAQLAKGRDLLVVASSDLCHYPTYDVAVEADGEFLKAVLTGEKDEVQGMDRKLMSKGYEEFHCTHCGHEPLLALLQYAKLVEAGKRKLLMYRNSGDVTGDKSQVVGYAAVAFCK